MGIRYPEDIVAADVTMKGFAEEMAEKIYKAYLLVESAKSLLEIGPLFPAFHP